MLGGDTRSGRLVGRQAGRLAGRQAGRSAGRLEAGLKQARGFWSGPWRAQCGDRAEPLRRLPWTGRRPLYIPHFGGVVWALSLGLGWSFQKDISGLLLGFYVLGSPRKSFPPAARSSFLENSQPLRALQFSAKARALSEPMYILGKLPGNESFPHSVIDPACASLGLCTF